MKSYTDLEQSRKLKKILPLESADMHYIIMGDDEDPQTIVGLGEYIGILPTIPAWSLSALIELFDDKAGLAKDYGLWYCYDNGKSHCTKHYDNPIDAAFEMVCWLKENGKI